MVLSVRVLCSPTVHTHTISPPVPPSPPHPLSARARSMVVQPLTPVPTVDIHTICECLTRSPTHPPTPTSHPTHAYPHLHTQLSGPAAAIDAFTENLEPEEVLPYLGPLMSGLLAMTRVASRGVQEMALSALASVIAAAHKAFLPYLGERYCRGVGGGGVWGRQGGGGGGGGGGAGGWTGGG